MAIGLIWATPFFSCTKPGLGGKTNLTVTIAHHGKIIPSTGSYPDSVWVKFDAQELPGTRASDFDAVFKGKPEEESILVEGLKPGKYYLFGVGLDTAGPYRVKGGIPIRIKTKDKDAELKFEIPVKE